MKTCRGCGTHRFIDYRPLALALPLPEGPHPHGPTVTHAGLMPRQRNAGQLPSALLAKVREANRRNLKGRP
ncbi:hypothetical protein FHS39_001640 [Streptomyces olivoverticillatus]|uniref:Uncharacterized protein n=2 Tax=Streptomyces olivoverticillatus TaxID=66427 RepID=A0A7W7LLT6_9ACTN|nr:hypothetical protein [Streptomyces olivoverticillatus]